MLPSRRVSAAPWHPSRVGRHSSGYPTLARRRGHVQHSTRPQVDPSSSPSLIGDDALGRSRPIETQNRPRSSEQRNGESGVVLTICPRFFLLFLAEIGLLLRAAKQDSGRIQGYSLVLSFELSLRRRTEPSPPLRQLMLGALRCCVVCPKRLAATPLREGRDPKSASSFISCHAQLQIVRLWPVALLDCQAMDTVVPRSADCLHCCS